VAHELRAGVGQEIAALAAALDANVAEQAQGTLAELGAIASSDTFASTRTAISVSALLARIDQKCRPLCDGIDYRTSTNDPAGRAVDSGAALALLRVAQELVRNAVTHGKAQAVFLDLTHEGTNVILAVRDDGRGLSAEALARSTGGLENARVWLGEQGGSLELVTPPTVGATTELRARLPGGP
jgi:signal transduction histidine kinase